jgi:hypothetical protein
MTSLGIKPVGLARLHQVRKPWLSASLLTLVAAGLPALGQAQAVNYAPPIVITKGGTYTGNYQSLSSGMPCVRIATSDPVILEGCTFSGAGNLIEAGEGADLTVRNCTGQGLAPSVNNQAPGRFLDTYRAKNLTIEHNAFTQTSGIVVNRWSGSGQAGQTLTVRYNRVRNIDGRWLNGGSTRSSFLILNTVAHVSGVDISYNEVINTANESLVEDNINLYNSSGTAQSAIRIHDNFVRGAYPFPATSAKFTGTGLTTDGDASTLAEAAGFIEADHNQFVGTANAAMNIAAGHDINYHDNRLVTSGYLPDGQRLNAGWAALGVFNYYNQPASVYFNNRVQNNTIGYVSWNSNFPYTDRLDLSPGACAPCMGTIHLPNPITTATEDAEATLWQAKLQQASVTVGPIGATSTPTPTPAPAGGNGVVVNPSFELDNAGVDAPTGWLTSLGNGSNAAVDYTEAYGGAHSGTYHGTHWRNTGAYEVYTYQTVKGLSNGTYAFSAWVKSNGGQPTAQLQAQNYGGGLLTTAITATNGSWVQLTVSGINVTNGQCEIGFYSKAKSDQFIYFDDVTLAPQTALATAKSVGNFSFEDDNAGVLAPSQWLTQTSGSTQAYASYSESYPNAHSGTYHGTHYRPEAYQIYTYQTVTGLPNGTYTLSAWVKSKGSQPIAQLRAQNYGGNSLNAPIPTSTDAWVQVTIANINVTNGQCEVGIYSQADAGQWLYFDDITLVPTGSGSGARADLSATTAATIPALYPNPANDQVTLTTTVSEASAITIVVSDLQGNTMASYKRQAVAGENQFVLNTNNLASGLYILRMQGTGASSAQRLEVKH